MSQFYIPHGSPSFAEHLFAACGIHHLARVIATVEKVEVPGLIVIKEFLESHGRVGVAIMYGPLLKQFLGRENSPVCLVDEQDYKDIPAIEQLEYAMPIAKELDGPYVNFNKINTHLLDVSFKRVMTPLFYSDDEGELLFFQGKTLTIGKTR